MKRISALSLALLCLAGTARAGSMTWEFREGRWEQVPSAATQPAPTDPQLDRIEELLDAGQWKQAHEMLLPWLKQNTASPLRDRGLFLIARVYYEADDHLRAYYHLDEILENYPQSSYFYPALELQYRIADEYLSGHKDKFLGIPMLGRSGEAIEMLYRLQQASPGSPLAERALLRTADYYYADLQYDLAADAYAAYVKSYPRSEQVPHVRLREAFSALAQFRGIRFDPSPILNARSQLIDIEQEYPQLAEEENVQTVIDQIDSTFAAKLYSLADYYRRTHEPTAAVYYYRLIVKTYPKSDEAKSSNKWLAKMPEGALMTKEPPASSGFVPQGSLSEGP